MKYNKLVITPADQSTTFFEITTVPVECDFTVEPLNGTVVFSWSAPIDLSCTDSQLILKHSYQSKVKLNITAYLELESKDFVFRLNADGKISSYSEMYTPQDLTYSCIFLCHSCDLNIVTALCSQSF